MEDPGPVIVGQEHKGRAIEHCDQLHVQHIVEIIHQFGGLPTASVVGRLYQIFIVVIVVEDLHVPVAVDIGCPNDAGVVSSEFSGVEGGSARVSVVREQHHVVGAAEGHQDIGESVPVHVCDV